MSPVLLTLGLFLVNPLLGFASSLSYSIKHPRIYLVITSVFFAVLAYGFVPYETMDLAAYYNNTDYFVGLSYRELIDENTNVFIRSVIKIIHDSGLNKEFLPFSVTLFSYIFYLKAFDKCFNRYNNKDKILFNLLILFSISFIASANGLRNGLATSIVIYSFSLLYERKYFYALIFSALASFVHSYATFFFIVTLFSPLLKQENIRFWKLLLCISMIVSIFSSVIIQNVVTVISHFIPSIESISNIYIYGERWSGVSLNQKNIIIKFFLQLPFYFSLFVLIRAKELNIIFKLAILSCCISLITSDFWVISERYTYAASLIFLCYFVSIESSRKNVLILFFLQFAISIWSLYRYRFSFYESLDILILPNVINLYLSTGKEFIRLLN